MPSQKIDWAHVMEFIAQQDAALAASCAGVARREINAIERQCGITLPSNYVDFLQMMGESSGSLRPFGETRIHTFSSLIERLPSAEYQTDRFFQVAFESDQMAMAFDDFYLDLTRSNGHDSPLVTFELENDSNFRDDPLSFTERVVEEVFWTLSVERQEFGAKVLMFDQEPAQRTKQTATHFLEERGFAARLSDLPQVACLTCDTASILITIKRNLVTFEFGGGSRQSIESPLRQLLAAFPDASLRESPTRRSESGT